jgi:hypothetical protein
MNKEDIPKLFEKKFRKKFWAPEKISNGSISIENREVTTWIHKSGHLGYMIYNDNGTFYTGVFERADIVGKNAHMCPLCCSVNAGRKMASFRRSLSKTSSVAVTLCKDLDCEESIANVNPNTIRETLTKEDKIERYKHHVREFSLKNLWRSDFGIAKKPQINNGSKTLPRDAKEFNPRFPV